MKSVLCAPKRPPRKKEIVTWDLEWYPGTFELRLAGMYDGERYRYFRTIPDFMNALLSQRNAHKYMYAHAGGRFDINFLLAELVKNPRYNWEAGCAGSSLIRTKIKKRGDQRAWYLIDSYRTFPMALSKMGKSVGIKKLDDYKCHNYPNCGHDTKCIFYAPQFILQDYNEQDCMILHKALTRYQDTLLDLGGELCSTGGASAMMLFRRRFLKDPIYTDRDLNRRAREAYVGSRVEVFRPEADETIRWYDINSSFPWSMTQPIPGNYLGCNRSWTGDLDLVRAVVSVPDMYVPPLAYRTKDGRVFHPTGTWEALFTGVDLRALIKAGGRVEKVKHAYHYESRTDTRDYAHAMFELRRGIRCEDPFLSVVYKLLANALYGKFAEHPEKQAIVRIREGEIVPDSAEPLTLSPECYIVSKYNPSPHEHVPAAAAITSRSRQYVGHLLRNRDKRGYKSWYCDTDSVATNDELATGDELGELKLEHICDRARFAASKTYYRRCAPDCPCGAPGESMAKMKGISRATVEDFEAFTGGRGVARMRQASPKEMLRKGLLNPYELEVEKEMRGECRPKRRPEGDNTSPWNVGELGRKWRRA